MTEGSSKKPAQNLRRSELKALHSLFHLYAPRFLDPSSGADVRAARLAWATQIVGREISSFTELRSPEAARLIELMKKSLGQETGARRRRPSRSQAREYGTAGRRAGHSSNEVVQLVDAPTLELLDGLLSQLGWSREQLGAFLRSSKSPVKSGAIRTLAEANRVIWGLKSILRHRNAA